MRTVQDLEDAAMRAAREAKQLIEEYAALLSDAQAKRQELRVLDEQVEAFEAQLALDAMGKEKAISGSNEETRRLQMKTFLHSQRSANAELAGLIAQRDALRDALAGDEIAQEVARLNIRGAEHFIHLVAAVCAARAAGLSHGGE